MERIKVYTHDDCKICIEVKEELNNNNILFEEKPILKFEQEWGEIVNLTRMGQTPVIYYKNNYFIANRDFSNPQNLINILQNYKEPKFSKTQQTNEMIKSLNFNTAIAFRKIDEILRNIENKLPNFQEVNKKEFLKEVNKQNKNKL